MAQTIVCATQVGPGALRRSPSSATLSLEIAAAIGFDVPSVLIESLNEFRRGTRRGPQSVRRSLRQRAEVGHVLAQHAQLLDELFRREWLCAVLRHHGDSGIFGLRNSKKLTVKAGLPMILAQRLAYGT